MITAEAVPVPLPRQRVVAAQRPLTTTLPRPCRPGGRCGVSLPPHVLAVTDAARHLDDVTAEVAWLLDHGAGFLLARGEPRSALALATDSYDLYRHRLGPDHPDAQTSARTLTDALHALGRHAQARRLLEEARIDPATHPRRTPSGSS